MQIENSIASVTFKKGDKSNAGKESSMFIGTTPEFEIALYTLLYFMSPKKDYNDNEEATFTFQLYNKEVRVRIVTFCDMLITAYPLIKQHQ